MRHYGQRQNGYLKDVSKLHSGGRIFLPNRTAAAVTVCKLGQRKDRAADVGKDPDTAAAAAVGEA